jgi:hypothetical protein
LTLRACSHASCLQMWYHSASYPVLRSITYMSCFHQMWYYSAWYVVLRSIIARASSDVGLLRVTKRCVFLEPTPLLHWLCLYVIRWFIKWFLSHLPTCWVIREIICCALYSTVFYSVFCVPTRGFMLWYVDSSCVFYQTCSVLGLAVSCSLAFDHPPCVISNPMLLCRVSWCTAYSHFLPCVNRDRCCPVACHNVPHVLMRLVNCCACVLQ